MKNYSYQLFLKAKESGDKEKMKFLYENYKSDPYIKLEYAKILIEEYKIKEGETLLLELLETKNYLYALLELGKLETSKNNNEKAKKYFSDLLKYGNEKDKSIALFWLGKIESNLGNYKESMKYFNEVLSKGTKEDKMWSILEIAKVYYKQDDYETAKNYFLRMLSRDNKKEIEYGIQSLIILNIKNNKLKEALENINFAIKNNIFVDYINILYLSKKLNVIFDTKYSDNLGYQEEQAIEYDPYYAIDHIIYRHSLEKFNGEKAIFNSNVDILKLFVDIKNNLNEETKLKSFRFNDMYLIPYDNIGMNGQNYLKVVTLPNTKDILSMYPVYNDERDIENGHNIYDDVLIRRK